MRIERSRIICQKKKEKKGTGKGEKILRNHESFVDPVPDASCTGHFADSGERRIRMTDLVRDEMEALFPLSSQYCAVAKVDQRSFLVVQVVQSQVQPPQMVNPALCTCTTSSADQAIMHSGWNLHLQLYQRHLHRL